MHTPYFYAAIRYLPVVNMYGFCALTKLLLQTITPARNQNQVVKQVAEDIVM